MASYFFVKFENDKFESDKFILWASLSNSFHQKYAAYEVTILHNLFSTEIILNFPTFLIQTLLFIFYTLLSSICIFQFATLDLAAMNGNRKVRVRKDLLFILDPFVLWIA